MKRKKSQSAEHLQKLHPIDAFGHEAAREGDIRVERLEKRLQPRVPFPHKHDFYHFLFLEKGSGWHEVDFTRFKVSAPQLFLMSPGQVHSWSLGAATRGFVLEFNRSSLPKGGMAESLLEALSHLPAMLSSAESKSLLPLFRLMREEFSARGPGYRAVLEHLLLALLVQLQRARLAEKTMAPKASGLAERFRALVEKHFASQHAVEFYAAELGTNTKALTTQVSRALGKSAGAVIQERCLIEAKRLLAYSSLPIAEIGYQLGYEDPNYFARFFRQKAGMSPGRFRELAAHSVPH